MTARVRVALAFAVAVVMVAAGLAWQTGLFAPAPPPLVESEEAVAAGRDVFAFRCTPCHRDVPLQRRVAGWSVERAYEVVGRLPTVPRANMPPFQGTEQDRRALAAFLSALGGGRASQP